MKTSRLARGPVTWSRSCYQLTERAILARAPESSALARASGKDFKGKASLLVYAAAAPAAFFSRLAAAALYVFVILLRLIPDRRDRECPGSR